MLHAQIHRRNAALAACTSLCAPPRLHAAAHTGSSIPVLPPANLQRGAGHKASNTTGNVLQLLLLLLPLRSLQRGQPLRSLQHPAAAAAAAAAAGNWLHAAVHLTRHPPCCLELQRRTAPLA